MARCSDCGKSESSMMVLCYHCMDEVLKARTENERNKAKESICLCGDCDYFCISTADITYCRNASGLEGERKPTDYCSECKRKDKWLNNL